MKLPALRRLAAAVVAIASAASAQAQTVTAADLVAANAMGANQTVVHGIEFGTIGGSFASKTLEGVTAVGVSGGAGGAEIDVGQGMWAAFADFRNVASLSIAFLFDGPEHNEVNEVAKVFLLGTSSWGHLTATGPTTASWSFSDGVVTNVSAATLGGAGVWTIANPFGSAAGTGLFFGALEGVPGADCPGCSNQSDYALLSVTAVPEPSTYALMLGGLLAVGSVMRRRRPD